MGHAWPVLYRVVGRYIESSVALKFLIKVVELRMCQGENICSCLCICNYGSCSCANKDLTCVILLWSVWYFGRMNENKGNEMRFNLEGYSFGIV